MARSKRTRTGKPFCDMQLHSASHEDICRNRNSFLLFVFLLLVLCGTQVALTQTDKRATRAHKSSYIEDVRGSVDKHKSLYVFRYENMRSKNFKLVRQHFREGVGDAPSRILLGKNKLMQIALGRSAEEEYMDNLRQVAKCLTGGSVGILFTSCPLNEVEGYFASMVEADFARAGSIAPRSVIVTKDMLLEFPVSMMEQFRKLGMSVGIENGKIVFLSGREEWRLCKEGENLSAEKCKLLVHFGQKISEFKVNLVCRWEDGEFEELE